MRYLPVLTLLVVLPLAFACARDESAATRVAFEAQLDEEWKYWMEQYPETATLLGYPVRMRDGPTTRRRRSTRARRI